MSGRRTSAGDALLADLRRIIAEHGWAVTGVGEANQCSTPGCTSPHKATDPCLYTVGLTDAGLPELVLEHLPASAAGVILNGMARHSLDGDGLKPGVEYRVAGVPATFTVAPLDPVTTHGMCKVANRLYGRGAYRALRVTTESPLFTHQHH